MVFKTSRIKTDDIPGIVEYRDALQHAFSAHSGKPSVTEYLKRLEKFSSQAYSDVLYVTDNGAGFDDQGMEAVLSEGSPDKGKGSSGSFGVGHLTTYALSSLKYVFYASKNMDGVMRAAGHAILSAQNRKDEDYCRSCHGYFLTDHKMNVFNHRQCCKGEAEVPSFLKRELASLETFGSIVCVLGFNATKLCGNSETLIGDSIRKAVAENFAVAIIEGTLEVEVEEKGMVTQISSSNIHKYLGKAASAAHSSKKNRKGARDTLARIETLLQPSDNGFLLHPLEDCELYLSNNSEDTQISIWRNGMLITANPGPGLAKNYFATKRPFHALVHLSGQRNSSVAHDLVRKAESTMHNKISTSELDDKKDKVALLNFYAAVRGWISIHAEEIGSEQHELTDEIMFPVGDTAKYNSKLPDMNISEDGTDPDTDELPLQHDDSSEENPDLPRRRRKRRSPSTTVSKNQANARVVSIWRNGILHVRIEPFDDVARGTLGILAMRGSDPSSEGRLRPYLVSISDAALSDGTKLEVRDQQVVVLTGVLAGQPLELQLSLPHEDADPKLVTMECIVGVDKAATRKVA